MSVRMKFGYFYREYKNEIFYWEFIKMYKKILIILILAFYSEDILIKANLTILILIGYNILSIKK